MTTNEPVKPPGSTWTDDQWKAVAARGRNVLVAAAAGSGKTAVLVERIIRRVLDEHEPIDVDRLLVATFTKAAASEMRERIREALEKALHTQPESEHLRRQLALIGRASITTLHSFCLEVVRQHIHALPLDPGFRIANDTEAQLLRQDAVEDVLESYYSNAADDSAFWQTAEWFGSGRGDDGPLVKLILELFEASRSHPEPERWLEEMAARFDGDSDPAQHPAFVSLMEDVRLELSGVRDMLEEALRLSRSPGGPAHYEPTLQDDALFASNLVDCAQAGWEPLYHAFQSLTFGSLKASRKDDFDKAVQEQAKKLRDTAKSQLSKLQEELFARSPAQFLAELSQTLPVIRMLVELVGRFAERFAAAKTEKALVDFSDLEHFALSILREPESGTLRPSAAALAYQEQFAEVMLDEYQDTNQVQESIVVLISRLYPGNRFMVGDVKQSIYRFRLAEPGLFLHKYRTYRKDFVPGEAPAGGAEESGTRIDLARNFRSRREVVDSVNFLFRQLMNESVGEAAYDEAAELVYGADYPELESGEQSFDAELVLIDRSQEDGSGADSSAASEGDDVEDGVDSAAVGVLNEAAELETAQLEARLIGQRIRELMGLVDDGGKPFLVYDKRAKGQRPLDYRDVVILLRATQSWAPVIIEELKRLGIPAYAELSTGYFEATEVETMLSLLKIIDNPLQDIPLAGVLRSPIVGLSAADLAHIRILQRGGSFAEAVRAVSLGDVPAGGAVETDAAETGSSATGEDERIRRRLQAFMRQLSAWRTEAQEGALSGLIWRIYQETGYYDFVGGMPGGLQRQANLRALYDRARQYEATTLRGLFRFLRFVERMRESGEDLGSARALGEQENVVRIMTIHKSKGLEFPVVFVAGMAKMFNMMDLNGNFLLHKELGFGPKYVDTALRVSYPTLQHIAVRRRIRRETLAEELRILYVALTRAREKLILLGTSAKLDKQLAQWSRLLECGTETLPDFDRLQAKSYLDWVGPAVLRHAHAEPLRELAGLTYRARSFWVEESSKFAVSVVKAQSLSDGAEGKEDLGPRTALLRRMARLEPIDAVDSPYAVEVERRLGWQYPFEQASRLASKTTVTEMKRLAERELLRIAEDAAEQTAASRSTPAFRRPQFMERRSLTAAERGTVYHAVMQVQSLRPGLTASDISETIEQMKALRLLSEEQAAAVDPAVPAAFFQSEVGQALTSSSRVLRELPFSYGLPAGTVYPDADTGSNGETVLIQGVIDCLFETEAGWVLLDYKTDAAKGKLDDELRSRYLAQLSLYAQAIEAIWRRRVVRAVLFFFDGCRTIDVPVGSVQVEG